MVRIPVTMATQHPDCASQYIPIQREADEAIEALLPQDRGGLGIDEVMIDYEGKITPYHQIVEVAFRILELGLIPGKEVNITPRIPSGSREGIFRQMSVLQGILEVNYKFKIEGYKGAVFEIIHPMTEHYEELVRVKNNLKTLSKIIFATQNTTQKLGPIYIIPLIESVPRLTSVEEIISNFIEYNPELKDSEEGYMRVFLGLSDAALKYGMVPSILSNKIAISDLHHLSEKIALKIHPIIGGGHLPFRGYISYDNKENLVKEYAGVKTVTIQSGLRYDSHKHEVISFINYLKDELQNKKPLSFSLEERVELLNIIGIFSKYYIKTLYQIVEPLSKISEIIPSNRDRLTSFGKLGYSRETPQPAEIAKICADEGVKKELLKLEEHGEIAHPMPRAIRYVASLYSVGIPPEIIGVGRALKELEKYNETILDKLLRYYFPSFGKYLQFAMSFINLNAAAKVFSTKVIENISEDVRYIKEYFNLRPEPNIEHELITNMLSEYFRYVYILGKPVSDSLKEMAKHLILIAGKERRSLG
ncbi:MAG: phosphoenolpyruvate carboxylase [Candidatus Odinarchaeia archaeon]